MFPKKIFLIFLFFLLCISFASAGSVARTLSTNSIATGGDVTVTLTVTVSGETYYAIDETIPNGWTIKNSGTGATDEAGHLKWVVIQSAANTAYNYVITAPSTQGTATITGTYMFEGDTTEQTITGASTITVVAATTCSTFADCGAGQLCCSNSCITPACVTNSDCGTGNICTDANTCNAQCTPASVGCTDDSNCSSGQICCNNACIAPACASSADCGTGQVCDNPGECNAECVTGCDTEADCASGQKCCSNACKTPKCSSNSDCTTGYQCSNPGECNAACNIIPIKKMSVLVPEYLVNNQSFDVIVMDDTTDAPIEGAKVTYAGTTKNTNTEGKTNFTAQKSQYLIKIEKEGYAPITIQRFVKDSGNTPGVTPIPSGDLQIFVVEGEVYINESFTVLVTGAEEQPIENAAITYGTQSQTTDSEGKTTLTGTRNVFLIKATNNGKTATLQIFPKTRQGGGDECNNNGECETELGETTENCPEDCKEEPAQLDWITLAGATVLGIVAIIIILRIYYSRQ
ncbi:MAG: hypothetical protein JW772_05600 [Candidatus Diapherotrites archaeon]|nr:hypothetical protein [Candidatus Diapherotrites archaeon]